MTNDKYKTEEQLRAMTMKQLRAYAKEIGCCLGYDGSRKDTAVKAILSYQHWQERMRKEAGNG